MGYTLKDIKLDSRKLHTEGKIYLTCGENDMTIMSSKGQIIIPVEMRKDIEEGEKLVVIKN